MKRQPPDFDDNYDPYGTNDPDVGNVNYGDMPSVPIRSGRQPQRSGDRPRPSNGQHSDGYGRPGSQTSRNTSQYGQYASQNSAPQYSDPRTAYRNAQPLTAKELRKKTVGRTRRQKPHVNAGVAVMMGIFAAIIAVCVIFSLTRRDETDTPAGDSVLLTDSAAVTEADTERVQSGFTRVSVPSASMHEGDLILVNYNYAYTFPENNDNVSMFDFKSKTYKVSDTKVILSKAVTKKFNLLMDDFFDNTACGDMMVVSGFRDFENQQRIYQDRVETQGAEMAAKYVADPGKSEHHTGLAMDLTVYLYDGSSYYVGEYPLCDWFEEHADEYGFVLRYPDSKAEITRISYESWHYRYVGTPHSIIMTERDLCLEEYTDFIREYEFGKKYLAWSDGKGSHDVTDLTEAADAFIYFIPVSDGETTDLFVPDGFEYTVSGNNADGFVVTAYKK